MRKGKSAAFMRALRKKYSLGEFKRKSRAARKLAKRKFKKTGKTSWVFVR